MQFYLYPLTDRKRWKKENIKQLFPIKTEMLLGIKVYVRRRFVKYLIKPFFNERLKRKTVYLIWLVYEVYSWESMDFMTSFELKTIRNFVPRRLGSKDGVTSYIFRTIWNFVPHHLLESKDKSDVIIFQNNLKLCTSSFVGKSGRLISFLLLSFQ